MRKKDLALIGIGGAIMLGGIGALASRVAGAMGKYLTISHGVGGSTTPTGPRYLYPAGSNVQITATSDTGYTIGQWLVDGVPVAGQQTSINVTMDTNHDVIVTFWQGGIPPPATPVTIISLGPITVLSKLGVSTTGYSWGSVVHVTPYSDDFGTPIADGVFWYLAAVNLQFRVVDAGGVGVPNVDVAVWTDADVPEPDSRYLDLLKLEGDVHTPGVPVIVKTDSTGVATVRCTYIYGLLDGYKRMCDDAGFGAWMLLGIIPIWHDGGAIYDGADLDGYGPSSTVGEGTSGVNLPGYYLHTVNAQIAGTALLARENVKCGFHIKWV